MRAAANPKAAQPRGHDVASAFWAISLATIIVYPPPEEYAAASHRGGLVNKGGRGGPVKAAGAAICLV